MGKQGSRSCDLTVKLELKLLKGRSTQELQGHPRGAAGQA